jgi:hypothetical protein
MNYLLLQKALLSVLPAALEVSARSSSWSCPHCPSFQERDHLQRAPWMGAVVVLLESRGWVLASLVAPAAGGRRPAGSGGGAASGALAESEARLSQVATSREEGAAKNQIRGHGGTVGSGNLGF